MEDLVAKASPAVTHLLTLDEDQLFNELGARLKALSREPSVGASFDVDEASASLESWKDFTNFGKKYFNNLNSVAHDIVCGSEEGSQAVSQAIQHGETAVAAAIAALLVSHLGLAAVIAAAVAALIVKIFFKATAKTLCESWKESLSGLPEGGAG